MNNSVYKEQKEELLKRTKLPKWVLDAISYMAYDQGHSGGMSEVDLIEIGMIETFEKRMEKS